MIKRLHIAFALLALLAMPLQSHALSGMRINIGGTVIHDNGAGDLDAADDIIRFDFTGPGYSATGTLNWSITPIGPTITLTQFRLVSTSNAPITDSLRFWSRSFDFLVDFNMALGLHLNGEYFNDSGTITGADAELDGYINDTYFDTIAAGSVMGAVSPAAFAPATQYTLWNPGFGIVLGGELKFALAGNGDGILLPTSASITAGMPVAQPVPAPATWLLMALGLVLLRGVRQRNIMA